MTERDLCPRDLADRRDEFGSIARAVEEVRNTISAQMTERMRQDDEAKAIAEAGRRAAHDALADAPTTALPTALACAG